MGQLGVVFEQLELNLQEVGEENLQSCYSPEEILEAIFKDVQQKK